MANLCKRGLLSVCQGDKKQRRECDYFVRSDEGDCNCFRDLCKDLKHCDSIAAQFGLDGDSVKQPVESSPGKNETEKQEDAEAAKTAKGAGRVKIINGRPVWIV